MEIPVSLVLVCILAIFTQPIFGDKTGIPDLVRRCPVPRCASPPLDACTEPNYKVIAGVRCFWCYKIVPCEKPEKS